jgi:hypothetical protein
MPDIEEVAARFKAWAAENGVLTYKPPEDELDYDHESLTDLTNATEAAKATQILAGRKINFIGVDPEGGKIIVCTHRKLTTRVRTHKGV